MLLSPSSSPSSSWLSCQTSPSLWRPWCSLVSRISSISTMKHKSSSPDMILPPVCSQHNPVDQDECLAWSASWRCRNWCRWWRPEAGKYRWQRTEQKLTWNQHKFKCLCQWNYHLGHMFSGSTEEIFLIISLTPCAWTSVMNPALPHSNHRGEDPVHQERSNQISSVAVRQMLHWKEDCDIS